MKRRAYLIPANFTARERDELGRAPRREPGESVQRFARRVRAAGLSPRVRAIVSGTARADLGWKVGQ